MLERRTPLRRPARSIPVRSVPVRQVPLLRDSPAQDGEPGPELSKRSGQIRERTHGLRTDA